MKNLKYILLTLLVALPILVSAKNQTVTINVASEPAGAKVYVDGKLLGTTPCVVSFSGKWVYDIDANRVNPNNPPYSKKFTFVLDGYETATEYWEGTYEYHESGIGPYRQKYYIVKPGSKSVMAVLRRDPSATPVQAAPVQSAKTNSEEFVMQCNIDSDPDEARVFWRIISQDANVRSTDQQYMGKTPFKDKKAFRISGLSSKNADKVKLELIIKKNGYYDVTKIYSAAELLEILELNGFFEMVVKE